MLQFCGENDLFYVESLKLLGTTPNICILEMNERRELQGEYSFSYDKETLQEDLSAMVTKEGLSQIIEFMLTVDFKEDWMHYIGRLCDRLALYTEEYFIAREGRAYFFIKPAGKKAGQYKNANIGINNF